MKRLPFHLITFLCFFSSPVYPQQEICKDRIIISYNVENLFDPADDPLTDDGEFTPSGIRHWTYNRLQKKITGISKVIVSAGEWNLPAIVTLCETENRSVLEKLVSSQPLSGSPYRIIHKESPDHRGIDVAMLYQPQVFYPVMHEFIPVTDEKNKLYETREILYVNGILDGADTLHIFVNHWPSRFSGLLETRLLRNRAAQILRDRIQRLFDRMKDPLIIVTGDFNDQPHDESIAVIIGAGEISGSPQPEHLYNLSFRWSKNGNGTLKYQSEWFVFDQLIVSGSLLDQKNHTYTAPEYAEIVTFPFLHEPDMRFGGNKPARTYYGYTYQGGFSDHLPVKLRLKRIN